MKLAFMNTDIDVQSNWNIHANKSFVKNLNLLTDTF